MNFKRMGKTVIIIGAGPAGLTAAYELVTKTDLKPIIIESTNDIGGISKTIVYHGNRIDIGGHRFFSKSEQIMKWWQKILPIQESDIREKSLQNNINLKKKTEQNLNQNKPASEKSDKVLLIRNRLSRIFFLRKFFDYPITINAKTLSNLGITRIVKIGWTYLLVKIFPKKKVNSLEDFFINRFGKELYKTFFKDYTEKVWGVSCSEIADDWGAQRIKELSVSRALIHALKSVLIKDKSIEQKGIDTSLIEQFLYPKLGPGQMWETVSHLVEEKGGVVIKNAEVKEVNINNNNVIEVGYIDHNTKIKSFLKGDYFLSSMPVKDLIASMGTNVPDIVKKVSEGLQYRDFITVGLLLNKLKIKNETGILTLNNLIPDNWIYIQERDVRIGRLQIFNNWSPYLVADINKVWIGLEYFCNVGDELWEMKDEAFVQFAINELHKINVIDKSEVIDSTIIRMPKTYPAYFGTYNQFGVIREFVDRFENLFLIGRNGMHKYNNQDHSMLTAITAVENIISGNKSKENIWNINIEEAYHEER